MPPAQRNNKPTGANTDDRTPVVDPTAAVAAEGWDVGQRAPKDQYAPLNSDGTPDLDKISDKPVKGYGTQLAVKGQVLSRGDLITLGRIDPLTGRSALVRTPVANPQGPGQVSVDETT